MFMQDLQIKTRQIQDNRVWQCADMNKKTRSQTLRPAYSQAIYSNIKRHKQAKAETAACRNLKMQNRKPLFFIMSHILVPDKRERCTDG